MRKSNFTLLFFLAFGYTTGAQNVSHAIDILLFEPVIGDPLSSMLQMPNGADNVWINYDGDMLQANCVSNGPTPLGWFIDSDFSFPNPANTDNDAFTSCSFLSNPNIANNNWLILPPIQIPDSGYQLCWRSLVSEAPAYVDGYKVVASTMSNLPGSGDFSHVLFTAAESIQQISGPQGSLNPMDYEFSEGYLHANGFTDTNYFYLFAPGGPLRGRLEPHCISLAEFAGQSIYLAFNHNSTDDSVLQLDDILVSNGNSVATQQPANLLDFNIIPNPAISNAYVNWTMKKPEGGILQLHDLSGKLILQRAFSADTQGQVFIDLLPYAPGVYQCKLQTPSGHATRKLVKI